MKFYLMEEKQNIVNSIGGDKLTTGEARASATMILILLK